jgi:hypothetical protein
MMELAAARLRVDDPWLLVVSGRGGWYRVGVAASRFPAPLAGAASYRARGATDDPKRGGHFARQ